MDDDKQKTLSIIIVNWNVRHLLFKCLKSIIRFAPDFSYEIFVVDNNSSDRSQEMLKSAFNKEIQSGLIKLILNDQNLGFAKANNLAIKKSKAKYVLLLNPDTEIIQKNTFEKMIQTMENNHKIGILGTKLLNSNRTLQPSVRRFPDLFSQAIILLKLHVVLPLFVLKKYFALDFNYDRELECDQVMGSVFLIREKVIKEIGILDEDYWIWFEEVDYCKRAQDKSWLVYYTPEISIVHYGSQSFKQMLNPRKQKEFNKSLLLYFKKHHKIWKYIIVKTLNPISILLSYFVLLYNKIRKQT